MNEITADKKYINDKTFWNYFRYHKQLFEQIVNNINDRLID